MLLNDQPPREEIKTSAPHMETAIDLFWQGFFFSSQDFLRRLKPRPIPSSFQKTFLFSEIT